MKTDLDFETLYRTGVGFDRAFNLLNRAYRKRAIDTWPPCNIVKSGECDYYIELAVAGFSLGDLDVTQVSNVLVVKGAKPKKTDSRYLHHGINDRDFERQFELADYVRVEGASLAKGLLRISLTREIPEAMKPRKITIGHSQTEPRSIATRHS